MTTEQKTPTRLYTALLAAQQAVARVPREGRSQHGQYACAADVIEAAREALHSQGLLLVALASEVVYRPSGESRESVDRRTGEVRTIQLAGSWILRQTWAVAHAPSGETIARSQEWPIVHHRGRELDLATPATATIALKYMLRDLLLYPEGEDVQEEREEPAERQAERSRPEPRAARQAPTSRIAAAMSSLAAASGSVLAPLLGDAAEDLAPESAVAVHRSLDDRIAELVALGWDAASSSDLPEPVTACEVVALGEQELVDGGAVQDVTETAAALIGREAATAAWRGLGARKGSVSGIHVLAYARAVCAVARLARQEVRA